MSQPVCGGGLLGLAPFGPFSLDSKVDEATHEEIPAKSEGKSEEMAVTG